MLSKEKLKHDIKIKTICREQSEIKKLISLKFEFISDMMLPKYPTKCLLALIPKPSILMYIQTK